MNKPQRLRLEHLRTLVPATETQEQVFKSYKDNLNLCISGAAGTGKTFISLYLALVDVMDKETILGCRKWKDVIVGYDVIDERTVYFTRRYLEDGFISPYTRNSFEYEDIMYVPRYIQELQ